MKSMLLHQLGRFLFIMLWFVLCFLILIAGFGLLYLIKGEIILGAGAVIFSTIAIRFLIPVLKAAFTLSKKWTKRYTDQE